MDATPFYYHPRMLGYGFGSRHPLKPERLKRAVELVERLSPLRAQDPGEGDRAGALRVHAEEYVDAVQALSCGERLPGSRVAEFGFGSPDNPPFIGMYEASLAYLAGSLAAAENVRYGAPLAISLSGGLHHARRSQASGFCIFNDPAAAVDVLLERFERVAYVDIDVHHGDGVQWIWYDEPSVMTCSIHQDGRTLYPGSGRIDETGAGFTKINVPLEPGTTGDVWLWVFREGIMAALERFRPEAIVLQMGTDAHFADPLARIQVAAQDWLQAVRDVKNLGLPIVAVGGGGYNLTTVPRMWAAAVFELCGIPYEDSLPADLAEAWEIPTFSDAILPGPAGQGRDAAARVIEALRRDVLSNLA